MNADSHNGVLNLLQLLRLNPPDQMLVTVGFQNTSIKLCLCSACIPQVVPDTIRGTILGFAARAPQNCGALCVQFDSSSMGLPYLLARAFQRVSCAGGAGHVNMV